MYKPARRSVFLCLTLLIALAAVSAFVGVRPVSADSIAQTLPMTAVFQQKEPIVIPVTAQSGKAEIDFPAPMVDKQGALCIKFRAFLNAPEPGGWSHYLKITLNGKTLGPEMPDGSSRLLNRGRTCVTTLDSKISWWNRDLLLTFFGPESELDNRVISPREEGYWYVLNVSDVANFTWIGVDNRTEGGVPNHLVIENSFAGGPESKEMLVKDLSAGYVPQSELAKLNVAKSAEMPKLVGKTLKGKNFSLVVADSGAMGLTIGKDNYAIASSFSYPGKTIGYNSFSWQGTSAPEWKTRIETSKTPGVITVKGNSSRYSVTRTITLKNGKVFIKDTIENKTDAPIGMMIRNEALVPKPFAQGESYICGVPDSEQ
ncbi:MAG TPA: hypothetical protein VGK34_05660, partial [Armatimonadota bacterium]